MKINGIYRMATFGAGFYVGYNEGKGIEVAENIENIALYGPTIFSTVGSLVMSKIAKSAYKFNINLLKNNLKGKNYSIVSEDNSEIKYNDLNPDEKIEFNEKKERTINQLEKQIENTRYFEPALQSGTITAGVTFLGYAAGKLTSQFN